MSVGNDTPDITWIVGHSSSSVDGQTIPSMVSDVGTPAAVSAWGHTAVPNFTGTINIDTAPALKFDSGKVPLELLPAPALEAIAEVLEFGRKKYAAWNWAKGFMWSRLIGAALRHLFAFARGEDRDPESGLSHLAHAGCCILFLITHERCGLGTDDRYKMEVK